MGVLSKAHVSLVFDADAWVDDVASATPSSSSPSSSSSSSSKTASTESPTTPTAAAASNPTGATSSSRAPHLYPVFEFLESRQRPPALGGGLEVQRAYQEWKAAGGTGPDASGVGHVRGRVVLDAEAGSVGRATVRVESVVVRFVRRDPMGIGAREVLHEETLWAAKDRGEEELAGSTSFPFSLPILPSLSPTFTEVPKATTTAALGTGHARGALYSVIAIVNRPLVHEIETAAVVFLRHAAPRQAIDRTPFAVHRGTIAGGTVAYTITAPRVVAASATATFPVAVRLFTAAARGSSPWTATGKTSEWFGATPAWARYLAGKAAEARKDLTLRTADWSPSKSGPVRECVVDGGRRRRGRGAEAVVIVMRDGGVRTDEANGEFHRYDQSRQQSSDGLEDIPVESDDEPPSYSSVAFGDAKERGGGGFGDEEDNDAGTLLEGPAVLARGGGGHGDGSSTSGGDADGDAAWAASVLGVGGGTTAATAVLSGEATLHLGTAGLRGDWCDGEFYLAHYADITLAPAAAAEAAAGGRRRWLVPKSEHGETVHVPFRVVYAADGDHAAGWVLPDEWDEWPWRRIEAMEGYKPLWMGRK